MKKKTVFALLIFVTSLMLGGCWSSHEVNTLGLAVAFGIDKAPDGYRVCAQLINPQEIAAKQATDESPVTVYTAEGSNIAEAIQRMTTLTSRHIYSSHLRMIVLSEEVASEGITHIVDYLLRFSQYRTDFYFAIARNASAEEILSVLTPIESIPGISLFEMLRLASEEWAPVHAENIVDLANDLLDEGRNPQISGVELSGDGDVPVRTEVLRNSEAFKKLRFTDIGVFNGDRLVGWLNEEESKGCNFLKGAVKRTVGFAGRDGIELSYMVHKAKSTVKASVSDGAPRLRAEIMAECAVIGVKGNLDVSKPENEATVRDMAEVKIASMCRTALEKAQKELKTDIFGFGAKVHAQYPAYWKSVKDSWNDVFSGLPVDVEVKVKVISTSDTSKPMSQKD